MEFEAIDWTPTCCTGTDAQEMLLQWNLDKCMAFGRFRYSGRHLNTSEDYMAAVSEFLKHASGYGIMGVNGRMEETNTNSPPGIEELNLTQLSMDMFNKLEPGKFKIMHYQHLHVCFFSHCVSLHLTSPRLALCLSTAT